MYTVSSGFKTIADNPQRIPQKRFTFIEGVTDYSDKLLNIGSFSQRQFEGDDLNGADITVELLNDSKEFNFLKNTKSNIGKIGKIELGFDGEYFNRYRGFLEDVEFFTDAERPKVYMVFTSRAQRAIDRTLGTSSAPLDLTGSIYNPADLAWLLLTTHGGLDSTASTANVDIDYASWSAYKSICSSLSFRLKAYFRGETIAEALRLIGKLTDALIYGETDGKIYFNRFIPKETYPSIYTFTEVSAHLQSARLYFNKSRIINRANVWYGYDPIGDTWPNKETRDNSSSQTDYGLVERDFNDTAVWHFNRYSAGSLAGHLVSRYFEPAETVVFKTKQGTQALIHQLGDNIRLTWSQVDYSSKVLKIYGISADLLNQQYEIEAEVDNQFGQAYFILNSATNGIIGTNKIF